MKFGYAIVLALVALVAVSGFASADRLPGQVPENQIFTISTLIDVTGAVSESSQVQWTIIDGPEKEETVYGMREVFFDNDSGLPAERTWITQAEYSALVAELGSDHVIVGQPRTEDTTTWYPVTRIIASNEFRSSAVFDSYAGVATLPAVVPAFANRADATSLAGRTVDEILNAVLLSNDQYVQRTTADTMETVYPYIHNSALLPGEEIALLTWTDSLRSNGGKLSLNKNIDFDSRNKGDGLYNLEVEKVLTYNSVEGAHLIGGEEWILDVAGNYEKSADNIRCVFAAAQSEYFPAFCNVVKAKSELININSAQISTKGQARAVAATSDIPAALNYQIAVSPDANTGSGFADGTVKTLFGGAIMEARGTSQKPAATNNWKDEASVTGGIKNFQKVFNYESGFTF